MQNEEQQSLKHDFTFGGCPTNSYYFANGPGLTYEVMFQPSGYLFSDFNGDVYEFIIRIEENILTIDPPADPLLPPTIAAIFRDFFKREGAVVVYICDSSDGRQAVRFRKFNSWYSYFEGRGTTRLYLFNRTGETSTSSTNHCCIPAVSSLG